jgi:hypothetical protein
LHKWALHVKAWEKTFQTSLQSFFSTTFCEQI